jgi:hypothetical protein
MSHLFQHRKLSFIMRVAITAVKRVFLRISMRFHCLVLKHSRDSNSIFYAKTHDMPHVLPAPGSCNAYHSVLCSYISRAKFCLNFHMVEY